MQLKEEIGMKGYFKIFTRQRGETTWNKVVDKNNLIVNGARTMIRDFLSSGSALQLQAFAIGTGTTSPSTTDTDLENPVAYSGADIYKAFEEFTEDDFRTVTYVGYLSSLEPAATTDITEIGLFTQTGTDGGVMLCRATFDAITKTNQLELRVEYSIAI